MKKLFLLLFALSFLLVGYTCQGGDVGLSIGAIGLGEGTGYALNKYAPGAVAGCEEEYDKMMRDTIGQDPVPAEYIIRYYNTSIGFIAANVEDPNLIIRRLGYLPAMYDGVYDANGVELISLEPIPRKVLVLFEAGYDTGKLQYLKDRGNN